MLVIAYLWRAAALSIRKEPYRRAHPQRQSYRSDEYLAYYLLPPVSQFHAW
jgi:hypothetical protein